ncbi:uncharacterized protein LOC121986817 [Zingiber officinale]|uniref:uncharacterized protein LOC121986817 n=1 Tax=Zingiber officinale TaxID=94328 RepID=UPI001C4C969B|nr:uncharacterized protein LOC121986817 [Zingiber officinale]
MAKKLVLLSIRKKNPLTHPYLPTCTPTSSFSPFLFSSSPTTSLFLSFPLLCSVSLQRQKSNRSSSLLFSSTRPPSPSSSPTSKRDTSSSPPFPLFFLVLLHLGSTTGAPPELAVVTPNLSRSLQPSELAATCWSCQQRGEENPNCCPHFQQPHKTLRRSELEWSTVTCRYSEILLYISFADTGILLIL